MKKDVIIADIIEYINQIQIAYYLEGYWQFVHPVHILIKQDFVLAGKDGQRHGIFMSERIPIGMTLTFHVRHKFD